MSKRKNLERAMTWRYRSGQLVHASILDKEFQARKQAEVDKALAKMGMVRAKPNIILPKGVKDERSNKRLNTKAMPRTGRVGKKEV